VTNGGFGFRVVVGRQAAARMNCRRAIIAAFLFAAGCTTLVYTVRYDLSLSSVERHERGGETARFTALQGHVFEDELVKITWTPFETQLGLILTNKTQSSQRVLWEEITYTGPEGRADRVVHEGIAHPSAPMPPSIVAGGGTLLDLLEPTAHIGSRFGGTRDAPLIGYTRGTSEGEVRSKMVHGTIKFLLPIETNGSVREYLFQFAVRGSVVLEGWSS
jgi:hypothetical protein